MRGATKIEGSVVLRKAALADVRDPTASAADRLCEWLQKKVYFQLLSADQIDTETGYGKSSSKAELEWNVPSSGHIIKDTTHRITFYWPLEFGTPGAIIVTNKHAREFFLKYVYIYGVPGKGDIHFLCNSWVYPKWVANIANANPDRVFFANNSYLPKETPIGLVSWRNYEIVALRGDGTGKRENWDRIYDYDFYNDLGDPDNDKQLERKVLGGSHEFPYPRRCRTGRQCTETSPIYETRRLDCILSKGCFFIPPDESFPQTSLSDFRAHFVKAFSKKFICDQASNLKKHFCSLKDVKSLYSKGPINPIHMTVNKVKDALPNYKMIKGILSTEDGAILHFPLPEIIRGNDVKWKEDDEFARQTLSGVNPMVIQCLQIFPPRSCLNAQIYGPQLSSITPQHILKYLNGISVEQAIRLRRLFILDYHDAYMPYVDAVNKLSPRNKLPARKIYATRTIFFLLSDGTLKPVAIELCLPPTSVDLASRRVFTPDYDGEDKGWLWQLAKIHVRANDSGYHQLVNHWLRTHAVVEPFIIATHRNLSKLHPLHKLLLPHFRNTMEINRLARLLLVNAEGVIEKCFSTGPFSMEISAKAYMGWRFNEQGLPADLLKRGMAVPDATDKANGLRLVVKDYPYAVDGLEIWGALKCWVCDYTSLYYRDDQTLRSDNEVQAWWKEIMEVGHGDKKHDRNGWYKMNTVDDLNEVITTLVWIASAHHAAVNFGQYGYGGFMPNLPSTTRRLIPEKGSRKYSKFLKDPEKYFLKTLSDPETATTTMAVLDLLSRHFTDEIYLGQGHASDWVDDPRVEKAFQNFRANLLLIEKRIMARNDDPMLKNRCGTVKLPYTLLFPNTSDESNTGGLTFKGIPTSISI